MFEVQKCVGLFLQPLKYHILLEIIDLRSILIFSTKLENILF